jgi:peptidoglycan-N-acetylglucosamine deacetylase
VSWRCVFVFSAVAILAGSLPALAACNDPDAIGVSRTLAIDTSRALAVGTIQYRADLPLAENEVVLTFDDGPLPGTTERVLNALDDACTHATFFTVGRMAKAYPDVLRREAADGNTIATHTWRHPISLAKLSPDAAIREIDHGIAAITAVLGHEPAPFFRFPGLNQTRTLRTRLAAEGIAVFSADVVGDDWTGISADTIRQRVLTRLAQHHGGIVLLHDTKHATAEMLPELLRDMKAAGYRIVDIVPSAPTTPVALVHPATVSALPPAAAHAVVPHPAL